MSTTGGILPVNTAPTAVFPDGTINPWSNPNTAPTVTPGSLGSWSSPGTTSTWGGFPPPHPPVQLKLSGGEEDVLLGVSAVIAGGRDDIVISKDGIPTFVLNKTEAAALRALLKTFIK